MKLLRKKVTPAIEPSPEPVRPPLVKGKPDGAFPDCVLVRVDQAPKHPLFVRLNPKYNFKETYYRYDKKLKKVRCLVTVMPDGLRVAWDTCRYCSRYFSSCSCKAGIQACRSIEYIYDSIDAHMKKEEWTVHHRNYRGSLTRAEREQRAAAPQKFVMPVRTTPLPVRGDDLPVPPPRPDKPRILTKPAARKPLLSKASSTKVLDAAANSDLSGMTSAAEELVGAMIDQLPRKLLRKVSTTPPTAKKLLRRNTQ